MTERHPPMAGSELWESGADRPARYVVPLVRVDLAREQSWDLWPTDKELSQALQLLGPSTGFLAVVIGTRQATKEWGGENWRLVLAGIADPALGLLPTGAADERDRYSGLRAGWPGPVINLYGETPSKISTAAIEHLDPLLCHDVEPIHLAAAVGTPCVAIFSNSNQPGEWFPFGGDPKGFHSGSTRTIQPSRVVGAVQDALALVGVV